MSFKKDGIVAIKEAAANITPSEKNRIRVAYASFVAALGSRGISIKLTSGTNEAWHDPDNKVIGLPQLPMSLFGLGVGYAIHEQGHAVHTDSVILSNPIDHSVYPNIGKILGNKSIRESKKVHGIWNALEDVWMENAQCDQFKGARKYIGEMLEYFFDATVPKMPKDPLSDYQIFHNFVLIYGRSQYQLHCLFLKQSGRFWRDQLRERFPSASLIESALVDIDHCRSTSEALCILDVIFGYVMDDIGEDEAKSETSDSQDGSNSSAEKSSEDSDGSDSGSSKDDSGDESDDDADGSDSDSSKGDSGDESDDDADGSDSDSSKGDSGDESDDGADGSDSDSSKGDSGDESDSNARGGDDAGSGSGSEPDPADDLFGEEEAISDLGEVVSKALEEAPEPDADDAVDIQSITNTPFQAGKPLSVISDIKLDGDLVDDLMSAVAPIVLADETRSRKLASSGSTLDRRFVSRYVQGSEHLYARRGSVEPASPMVVWLNDDSGSMSTGIRSDLAAWRSALAFREALRVHGVGCGLSSFPHFGSAVHVVCTPSEEQPTEELLPYIPRCGGGTPIWEAITATALQMSTWDEGFEKDRILIVTTDGKSIRRCSDTLSLVQDLGVKIFGVGVGVSVSHLFDRSVNLDKSLTNVEVVITELAEEIIIAKYET